MYKAMFAILLIILSLIYRVYGESSLKQISNCTCVPYYQCSEESGKIITDGSELLDERGYSENKCTGYFDVCCDLSKEEETTVKFEEPKGCGYMKSELFPWTVSLHFQSSAESPAIYKCGASLIHPQVVVTAAHCFTSTTNQVIWTIQIGNSQRTIKKIIIHRGYNSITLQNDLALAILNDPVEASDNVNVICIPPPATVLDQTRCILSSLKTPNFFLTTPYIQLLKLPIVSPHQCVKALQQTRLGVYFKLHKSFICAGGEANKDACGGDGGSPLVCPVSDQPGRYHQVGIVSWGIGCGEFNVPGVYVNLAIFRDWIDEQMLANGFNINVYRY